ncbi:MAG: glycosyltransferase [Chloracidobacterium sp.]|nr:glycosyltransferase [Chloracidobacterium sp.]
MQLSVVIPAYNEEDYLGPTVESVVAALGSIDRSEWIVVDNESTDRTVEVAKSFGAAIITESKRSIGAVRNAGGRAATGEVIVFLDADTRVRPGVFDRILEEMSDPACVGGSVAVEYDTAPSRWWVRYYVAMFQFWGKVLRMRQGAAQFCRRSAFEQTGGCDPTIFVGEDIEFHWRLDKLAKSLGGRTVFIESPRVITSSRRWDKMGLIPLLFFSHPVTILIGWRRPAFWKAWYENAIR